MAGKIINMSKVKQVLRLHTQGVSNRRIALDLGLYRYCFKKCVWTNKKT